MTGFWASCAVFTISTSRTAITRNDPDARLPRLVMVGFSSLIARLMTSAFLGTNQGGGCIGTKMGHSKQQ